MTPQSEFARDLKARCGNGVVGCGLRSARIPDRLYSSPLVQPRIITL